jgi:O-antigen/teichoic acid export membrane protein
LRLGKSGVQMRRTIPAGVLDAGMNSAATFAMGIYAAKVLPPYILGGYALVFSAFLLMMNVPWRLVFNPAEIAVVSFPDSGRIGFLRHTLKIGALPALVAALSVSVWTLVAPPGIPRDVVVALTVTGVACTFVSPVQDHVRRMLHTGGASWRAAVTSAAQLFGVIAAIWLFSRAGVAPWWVPFGSLTLANIFSLFVAWVLEIRNHSHETTPPSLSLRELARSGRWILLVGLMQPVTTFISNAIVSHLAGAKMLGYAEAARQLGQPPAALALGLAAVLGPRSIHAAQRGDLRAARHISRIFAGLMLASGLPYLALFGFGWHWNPVAHLLPNAYAVWGLVAATVVSNILHGMQWPYQSELLGARREVALARIELVSNAVRLAIAGTAGVIGPFALPAGFLALRVVRSVAYRATLRSVYKEHRTPEPEPTPAAEVATLPEPLAIASRDGRR